MTSKNFTVAVPAEAGVESSQSTVAIRTVSASDLNLVAHVTVGTHRLQDESVIPVFELDGVFYSTAYGYNQKTLPLSLDNDAALVTVDTADSPTADLFSQASPSRVYATLLRDCLVCDGQLLYPSTGPFILVYKECLAGAVTLYTTLATHYGEAEGLSIIGGWPIFHLDTAQTALDEAAYTAQRGAEGSKVIVENEVLSVQMLDKRPEVLDALANAYKLASSIHAGRSVP